MVLFMTDARDWFSSMAKRRVTAIEMADALGISRNAAQSRIAKGFSADDLIQLSRHFGFSPIHALVELGTLTYDEVFDLIDGNGKLVTTADEGELALELARRLNPATKAPELDALEATADNWREALGLAARTPDKDDPRHE